MDVSNFIFRIAIIAEAFFTTNESAEKFIYLCHQVQYKDNQDWWVILQDIAMLRFLIYTNIKKCTRTCMSHNYETEHVFYQRHCFLDSKYKKGTIYFFEETMSLEEIRNYSFKSTKEHYGK